MQRSGLASMIAISTCLATGACGSDGGAADTGGDTTHGGEASSRTLRSVFSPNERVDRCRPRVE